MPVVLKSTGVKSAEPSPAEAMLEALRARQSRRRVKAAPEEGKDPSE